MLFALISVFFKTIFYVLQKKYIDDDVSPYTTAYVSSLYGCIIITPLAFVDVFYMGTDINFGIVLLLIFFGLFESAYLLFYLFALKNLNLSIASPVKKSKPVFIGLAEPVILGAKIPFELLASSGFATVGGFLAVFGSDGDFDEYKNDLTKIGILFALITLFLSVGISLISRYGTSEISPFVFGSGILLTTTVVTRFMLFYSNVEERKIKIRSKKGLKLGITGSFRSISVWMAYSLIVATAVSTITQMTLIFDVLLASYLLDEDVNKTQWAGVLLILIGSIAAIIII